jgi:hypothetical protein
MKLKLMSVLDRLKRRNASECIERMLQRRKEVRKREEEKEEGK